VSVRVGLLDPVADPIGLDDRLVIPAWVTDLVVYFAGEEKRRAFAGAKVYVSERTNSILDVWSGDHGMVGGSSVVGVAFWIAMGDSGWPMNSVDQTDTDTYLDEMTRRNKSDDAGGIVYPSPAQYPRCMLPYR
jgi:hypothetical protein